MASFDYVAIDQNGKEKKGSMEGQDAEGVKTALKAEGMIPLTVSEQNMLTKDISLHIGKSVKSRDLSIFCRQFGSILGAGVTVVTALDMLGQQTENKVMKGAIQEVQSSVEKGETLAGSMALHPKVFPSILVSMIEAGEASGSLETSLDRMSVHFEKDAKLKSMAKSAMIYPIAVCVVAIGVVAIMMIVVLPQYKDMFADVGSGLPGITLFVMGVSDFFVSKWWVLLLIAVLVVATIKATKRTDAGQLFFGKLSLRMPLLGNVNRKTACARLTRTLSTLLAAGMSMIDAVEIVAKTMDNEVIKRSLLAAKEEVARGVPLSQPLEASGLFPPMVYHMAKIGEETGNMEEMLGKVADYYDEEVETATKNIATAVEPIIIVVLAGIVSVIILAIMMPMMGLYNAADGA